MDKVVPAHSRNKVFIYIDDLYDIKRAGLTLNIAKYHLCMLVLKSWEEGDERPIAFVSKCVQN